MKIVRANWWKIGLVATILFHALCSAHALQQRQSVPGAQSESQLRDESASAASRQSEADRADEELKQGTTLTRRGKFKEAIPHLLAARGNVTSEYALEFNLSLCYVGVGDGPKAISILEGLRQKKHDTADVENLLAQAYVGKGQRAEALAALERAAAISPQNEKLFAFVADACTDAQDF